MSKSQNGWPVVGRDKIVDKAVLGVEFPNGWLKGDVDVLFSALIVDLNKIERIDNGGCWGWGVKKIEGSNSISNHSSGTAIDYNAPAHPMGVRNTYSKSDRDKINALLKGKYEGVIRWGGNYTGRPDDMHFEIDDTPSAVKRVADKIRGEKPREIKYMNFEVTFPVLKQGDNDGDYSGYNIIVRIQRIVKADDDGVWGPKTSEAVAEFVKLPIGQCRTLTEDLARRVFGLRY